MANAVLHLLHHSTDEIEATLYTVTCLFVIETLDLLAQDYTGVNHIFCSVFCLLHEPKAYSSFRDK